MWSKKSLLIFVFAFIVSLAMGQRMVSGEIVYKVKSINHDERVSTFILNRYPYIQSVSDQLLFTLVFNKKGSFFRVEENQINHIDKTQQIAAKAFAGYVSPFWQDSARSYTETKMGLGRQAERVLQYENKRTENWVITEESKMIGIYRCFKATRNDLAVVSGGHNVVKPVIACLFPAHSSPH